MIRALALGALVASGCSSSAAPAAGSWDGVEATSITCSAHVEGQDRLGPAWCRDALAHYLHDHPDERIASVVGLDALAAGGANQTQALLVVHTSGDGPWLRARELDVGGLVCAAGPGAIEPGSQLRRCDDAVVAETSANHRPYTAWFAVVSGGPAELLFLYRRGE